MDRWSTAFLAAAAALLVLTAVVAGPRSGAPDRTAEAPAVASAQAAPGHVDPPPGSGRRWS